jgi:hypothetical protein
MSLADLYTDYLVARRRAAAAGPLGDALAAAGLATEAELWRAWCDGKTAVTIAAGPWTGRTAHLGSRAPAIAAIGDVWFDVCELVAMIHVGRSWLATRPVAAWQMRGFLAMSVRLPREVQVAPGYTPLDPDRVAVGDRVTNVTAGEATLYAWWFGKTLPNLFDWGSAVETLPGTAMRELWRSSAREWTSSRLPDDEAVRVFVTPSTIDWVPSEVVDDELERPESRRAMLRGELTRDPQIGFRTAVALQSGLLARVSAWDAIPEPIKLDWLIDRDFYA